MRETNSEGRFTYRGITSTIQIHRADESAVIIQMVVHYPMAVMGSGYTQDPVMGRWTSADDAFIAAEERAKFVIDTWFKKTGN